MKAFLPGKPESQPQALATGVWDSRRITVYISGNSISIIGESDVLLQTVYDDDVEPFVTIAFDENTGKIAAATKCAVRIYKPCGPGNRIFKWALQFSFPVDPGPVANETKGDAPNNKNGPETSVPTDGEQATAVCLAWGDSEELAVGCTFLELYQTASTSLCSWRKRLANPVCRITMSGDSGYIASIGRHDQLVKVWRRLSFGANDVRFDLIYLRHPAPVVRLEWRRPSDTISALENVLYTFCSDRCLRVWRVSDGRGHLNLKLRGKVKLEVAEEPGLDENVGGLSANSGMRWAFTIQGKTPETVAAEWAKPSTDLGAGKLSSRTVDLKPDTVVVVDKRGRMAAWVLHVRGPKALSGCRPVKAGQAVFQNFDLTNNMSTELETRLELYGYCCDAGRLHLLMHSFDGRIDVWETNFDTLLSPKPKSDRLQFKCTWTGHSGGPIQKMVRNVSGRAIVSRTVGGQTTVWKHVVGRHQTALSRQVLIQQEATVLRMCVLRKGHMVVFLHPDRIAAWDCCRARPVLAAEQKYQVGGKPLCLVVLPKYDKPGSATAHIATITAEKNGIVWELKLRDSFADDHACAPVVVSPLVNRSHRGIEVMSLREFSRFELTDAGDLSYVLPVDPAGASPISSGFLDVFALDVAISYTHSGRLEFWTARVDVEQGRTEWLSTGHIETSVENPALVSGSTMKKAALVNSSRLGLTIWDVRGGQLEFSQDHDSPETISDLDWASTPDAQSILAVGFPHRVLLLSQMRFDYLNKGPAWAPIREISILDVTPHPIGDSTWLGDGHLVIGSGHQLFVHDRQFDASSSLITSLRLPERKKGKWDLFEVVQRLNGPLAIFHPQFLSQCMLAGKTYLVHRILLALHNTLKFWIEGEDLDNYVGIALDEFYTYNCGSDDIATVTNRDDVYSKNCDDDDHDAFGVEVAQSLSEKLTTIGLPQLSGHEQMQLVDMIECLATVEKQRRSLDENGARFMLFYRQHALRKHRASESSLSWREINWAYHSGSQDILTDFVTRQHPGPFLWEHARESGIFMWLTDGAAVKAQFELIARNEYGKNDPKNPVDCSIFYLALRKKAVLQGLWRISRGNREQIATEKLLAQNYEEAKHRTTALKNAFALLAKRRFEYAAAFFILADHLQDAVNVCFNQLRDMQLAIAVARVYEGDNGPVLRNLLDTQVLGLAARDGNRWLASWAFWMLHRRDMAVRALITPVSSLLETSRPTGLESKLFLTDDPALVVLYALLRQKTLQTLRGASKVSPKDEWSFVLHNARLYDRMGCDLLGLDLVRNWEFLKPSSGLSRDVDGEVAEPLKLVRRRSSLIVDDLPLASPAASYPPMTPLAIIGKGRPPQPAPTVFEEPDSTSLLDSFGF